MDLAIQNVTVSVISNTLNNSNCCLSDSQVSEVCTDFWCILQTICITLITLLIILTNLTDIAVISFCFDKFGIPEYFMLSLACADLGVGTLVTPFSILSTLHGKWMYGELWCSLSGMLVAVLCSISIFSLVLISVDRYIAVIHSLRYTSLMTTRRCLGLIATIWIVCITLFVGYRLTANQFYYDHKSSMCSIDFPSQSHFTVFIVCTVVMPSTVALCIIYWKIFLAAKKHRKQIQNVIVQAGEMVISQPDSSQNSQSQDQTPKDAAVLEYKVKTKELKSARMFVFIIGSYSVGWMPYSVLQVILCTTDIDVPDAIVFIILWTAMANSFWNSIIYFVMHAKYRQGCIKIWRYLCPQNRIADRGNS